MATPRGALYFSLTNGGGEVSIAGSIPTFADSYRVMAHSASVVWTDIPTGLASALTATSGVLLAPANGPIELMSPPTNFRIRDLGAAAQIVIQFYEGADLGI